VPLDAVAVLVVEHRQTGLVIELLVPLHGQTTLVLDTWKFPLLLSLIVVRLRFSRFSSSGPKGVSGWYVGGWDPCVAVSPEPTVDIDGL